MIKDNNSIYYTANGSQLQGNSFGDQIEFPRNLKILD